MQYPLQLHSGDHGTLHIALDAADIWNQLCVPQDPTPIQHTKTCKLLIQIVVIDTWKNFEVHRSSGTLVYLRDAIIEAVGVASAVSTQSRRAGSVIDDWYFFPTAKCTSGVSSCGKI